MANKLWVVRVVIVKGDDALPLTAKIGGEWIESLRYAGLIRTHEVGLTLYCFDLPAPHGTGDTKAWAEMNAKRMKTFGINAAAAPSTV
jgi:hypothetical protein